ncbi:MAG: ketoacyl-ACP synthase III [Rickettsiales bacterium]|nr:ketoacyl-ACP synthase III [Rickettsiales bacterium]
MLRSVINGIGHYLPEKIVTNKDLEATLETSDEWIRERTGIEQRHIAAEGELTSHLATKAAQAALDDAGVTVEEIGAIIVATTTPDETFPATAVRVQAALGAPAIMAFDMQAACSGFIYGLTVADGLIKAGQIKHALVIGAETYSRIVDWEDRGTCILFGDGAGAVVLSGEENSERGLLHSTVSADGNLADILKTTGGVSSTKTAGVVHMQGREVFRHAVSKMTGAVKESLEATGYSLDDVDWLIPHQANARILTTIADKLGYPREKVVMTTAQHANTSAATIPLAMAVAKADGRLKPGNLIALPALGAGLTWGNCLVLL